MPSWRGLIVGDGNFGGSGLQPQPGRIVCEFAYPEDFWSMIDALADIAAQDPEAFENATLAKDPQ